MNHFCMRCSVFENAGWKAGSSVAYCETCIEEKMTKELNHKDVGHEEDFQKKTCGAKIREAGQSAKPDSLKRYSFSKCRYKLHSISL